MEQILSMALSGSANRIGGEWVISIGMRHHGDVTCTATKRFPLPVGADPIAPWEWALEVLHAVSNELDCLCDVELSHGIGCPEASVSE